MEFLDLKELAVELMESMEERSLTRITLKQGDLELTLEKTPGVLAAPMLAAPPHLAMSAAEPEAKQEEVEEGQFISSPVVGTYYAAPAPGEPDFVKVGDSVSEDTVVGIIEAMKVMNEVKAGIKGVIAEVITENAHPVEFGTHLFRVK